MNRLTANGIHAGVCALALLACVAVGQHTGHHGYPSCDLCFCAHQSKGSATVRTGGSHNTTDANCQEYCQGRPIAHNGTCVWDGGCRTQCTGDWQWGDPNPCGIHATRRDCDGAKHPPVANTCRFTGETGKRPLECEACYTCDCLYGFSPDAFLFHVHSDTPVTKELCKELCPMKEGEKKSITGPCGEGSCPYCPGGCKMTANTCPETAHGCEDGQFTCLCSFTNSTTLGGCLGPA